MNRDTLICRRAFLRRTARLAAAVPLLPHAPRVWASVGDARALAFEHTHTRESLSLVYAADGRYLPDALAAVNRFLRDHYSGEVGSIDPRLLDQLHALKLAFGSERPFHVISGYRCPTTNEKLRARGGGGVARGSLHLEGRAIDIRLPGVALARLREGALDMKAGGVGFYPASDFVHIDTGRVRHW
jgi:uncharacterized protein YcbK (DUF882 family)